MYIVFDIGGTNLRVACSPDGDTITHFQMVRTPFNYSDGISVLTEMARALSTGSTIQCAVGGIPGLLDESNSVLVGTTNLRSWECHPLRTDLERLFEAPVYLENDADLGGLGEATRGAGVGHSRVGFLAIGTGVGGTLIVDSSISRGTERYEPGHQVIVKDGRLCGCGDRGHLEAYVSGRAIQEIYGRPGEVIEDTSVWNEMAQYLALGVEQACRHWAPDILVLGGSVARRMPVAILVAALLRGYRADPPCVVLGTLHHYAVLYGALSLLRTR